MRYLIVLLACCALQGCLFFYIPPGLFAAGNMCVPEGLRAGQRITNDDNGKSGVVKELLGRSDRCQNGRIPILATVEYD